MRTHRLTPQRPTPQRLSTGILVLGSLFLSFGVAASLVRSEDRPTAGDSSKPDANAAQVALARVKAELLHDAYSATLDVIHERYFRNDRSAVPARAMEDVFDMMARQSKIEARWIGVNARTMSINHEPKDDFEKSAAEAIRSGKEFFERVEDGHLRRAGAIPLTAGCLTCHGTFGLETKSPRYAGLVIKVPLDSRGSFPGPTR